VSHHYNLHEKVQIAGVSPNGMYVYKLPNKALFGEHLLWILTRTNHEGLRDWQDVKEQLPRGEEAHQCGDDSLRMADC
jgi:hypothetical protein